MTRTQTFLVTLIALILLVLILLALPAWVWHPLGTQVCRATYKGNPAAIRDCMSYNFHSGIEANLPIAGQFFALCVLIVGFWHRHNCHTVGCLWPVRHGKTRCTRCEKKGAA